MAYIRSTNKFIEGDSQLFFTENRAQLALQPTVTSLENEDSGMKLRLDVIEGGAGVEGSIAKAQADAQSYADQQIAALVNSAPEVLDTLKELSDAIGGDASFATTVANQIGAVDAKVDQEILDREAAVSGLQSSVNSSVSSLQSVDNSLSLRLDALELDPVTKSYVDSQDSSESSARQSADSALSGRLDTLEQDPTTKTYVDGEVSGLQGQITQEISARQAGDSALDAKIGDLSPLTIANESTYSLSGQIIADLNAVAAANTSPAVQGNWSDISQLVLKTTDGLAPSGGPNATNLDFANSYIEFVGDPNQYSLVPSSGPSVTGAISGYEFSEMPGSILLNATSGLFRFVFVNPGANLSHVVEFSFFSGQQRVKINEHPGNGSTSIVYSIFKDYTSGTEGFSSVSVPLTPSAYDLFFSHDARLDVLEADPTTKSYVDSADSTLQSNLDAEEAARIAADGVLQSNLDAEEAARIAAVSAEEAARIAADSALSGRLDVLETDPTTKTYVDGEVSDLQGQVDIEKGRIDAILSASEADKDSFAEIVNLINSVDTENDNAFASYVLNNDAALAQEVSDRQAGDSALSGRLDVLEADPTTKAYVDGEVDSLEAEDLTMVKLDGSRSMTGGLNITSSSTSPQHLQVRLRANNNGAQLTQNQYIGEYRFQVLEDNLSTYTSAIKLQGQAIEDHSASGLGSVLNIEVSPAGSTNREVVMSMYGDKVAVKKPMEFDTGFEMGVDLAGNESGPGKIEFQANGFEQEIKIGILKQGSDVKYPARFMSARAQFERGLAYSLRSYGVNRQINDHEPYIAVTAVNVTFTLPASPVNGQVHTFKDVTGSCDAQNPITLSGSIDGGNSYQLTAPYESVMVMWNSTANMWMLL